MAVPRKVKMPPVIVSIIPEDKVKDSVYPLNENNHLVFYSKRALSKEVKKLREDETLRYNPFRNYTVQGSVEIWVQIDLRDFEETNQLLDESVKRDAPQEKFRLIRGYYDVTSVAWEEVK